MGFTTKREFDFGRETEWNIAHNNNLKRRRTRSRMRSQGSHFDYQISVHDVAKCTYIHKTSHRQALESPPCSCLTVGFFNSLLSPRNPVHRKDCPCVQENVSKLKRYVTDVCARFCVMYVPWFTKNPAIIGEPSVLTSDGGIFWFIACKNNRQEVCLEAQERSRHDFTDKKIVVSFLNGTLRQKWALQGLQSVGTHDKTFSPWLREILCSLAFA